MILNIDLEICRQPLIEKLRDEEFEKLSHVYREGQEFMTANVYAGPGVLDKESAEAVHRFVVVVQPTVEAPYAIVSGLNNWAR